MKKITFIATDLETTGLSPQNDTIIEVAAVKFDLIYENKKFRIENSDERTMLVNPLRELDEEITLITHITNEMVREKSSWSEIQPKIKEFFNNDAVILGHNVFFDIAMFASHGIDLSSHPVLDTFELSEILAQNATSLNLGFLGDFYGVEKKWQEHRALTDVKIDIDLMIKFLEQITEMTGEQKKFLQKFLFHKNSPYNFLEIFFEEENDFQGNFENIFEKFSTKKITKIENTSNGDGKNSQKKFEVISLENNEKTEINLIKKTLEAHKKIQIITTNRKTSEAILAELQAKNLDAIIRFPHYQFIFAEGIFEKLAKISDEKIERKYFIFLVKMGFWTLSTKTWLVNELKYYGEEFDWLEDFRLNGDESNIFRENHEKILGEKNIIIENFHKNIRTDIFTLYRDFPILEGIIRKNFSETIDFEKLIKNISKIENSYKNPLISAIRAVEAMYAKTPNRPTGENPIPPGKYGETYFIRQNDLWCAGFKWLAMANKELFENWKNWENKNKSQTFERNKTSLSEKISSNISLLVEFNTQEFADLGVILTIVNDEIRAEFISQKIPKNCKKFFENGIGYGFHLSAESVGNFIEREFSLEKITLENTENPQITQFLPITKSLDGNKTLILTTSMKHIREIGARAKNICKNIFLQGTSGGKSKMKHYFLENPEKSILIGLIDSWWDEAEILKNIDTIIIAKIPFDPPTDPHFLAKTIGMSNSFELYSKPIVLSRLNSLIGNANLLNKNIKIICADERIDTTEWGKFMKKNLF